MGLARIYGRHIEKRASRYLVALCKGHPGTEVHLRQWVALLHSHCYMNQKIGDEVVTADNSHWRIFETDRYHVLVCKTGMNYFVSSSAWNGDEHREMALRKESNFPVLVGIHGFRGMS